jgi:DUF971 family protein
MVKRADSVIWPDGGGESGTVRIWMRMQVETMAVRPKDVTLNKTEGFLEITWDDDRVCRYPLPNLREACPCVECRGGHAFMGPQHEPDDILKLVPARSYRMADIQMVGNYAIQPVWDDGHQTGIYTWDYLYRICPDNRSDTEMN